MLNNPIIKFLFAGLIATVLLLAGCRRQSQPALRLIFIVDLTGSIEPSAQTDIFSALHEVFTLAPTGQHYFRHLQRGDSVTVIPIISTALETQGRILRFNLSQQREAYDEDLKRLAQEAEDKLKTMQQGAAAHPQPQSDLLGALELAAQERGQHAGRSVIVVLSDLIQDDGRFDFKRDGRLANAAAGKALATTLAQAPPAFAQAFVYLGLLRSGDLKKLSADRQAAIRAFWTEYLQRANVARVEFATDGSGRLPQFLEFAATSSLKGAEGSVNDAISHDTMR